METSSASTDNLLRSTRLGTADTDPGETREWLEALEDVVRVAGHDRALALLRLLEEQAQQRGIVANVPPYSAYRNTIPLEQQPAYPGDLALEERITAIVRWNALAMVVRANRAHPELGGHIASYASAADLANAMRRAETAHGAHEKLLGHRDEDWPGWYAAYMIAEQTGVFLCSNLSQRESPRRYRVPVEHRRRLCQDPHRGGDHTAHPV